MLRHLCGQIWLILADMPVTQLLSPVTASEILGQLLFQAAPCCFHGTDMDIRVPLSVLKGTAPRMTSTSCCAEGLWIVVITLVVLWDSRR